MEIVIGLALALSPLAATGAGWVVKKVIEHDRTFVLIVDKLDETKKDLRGDIKRVDDKVENLTDYLLRKNGDAV